MKKIIVIASALAIATSSLLAIQSIASADQAASRSDLISASVESLTSEEGVSKPNGGPRKEVKCKEGYHKMACLSMNEIECTDSECY